MIYPISLLSGGIYRRILKPILFRIHPDKIHAGMISLGAKVQKFAILRGLLRASWNYENREMLSQEILGMEFKNPLGLSAGLDKNAEILGVCSAIGFGQAEFGSITFEKCAGNPQPWFFRLPKTKSIVVHVGLANHGAPRILKRVAKYPARQIRDLKLNANVAYTNKKQTKTEAEAIADYVGSLKMIRDYNQKSVILSEAKDLSNAQNNNLERSRFGLARRVSGRASRDVRKLTARQNSPQISLIDLNISCPNTYGGEPFTTPAKLEKLLKAVDAVKLKTPLFVKMPVDKTPAEFDKLLDVILRHDVAGVTISNLFKDREKVKLSDDLPDSVAGNLSGAPTFAKSNQLIAQTYRKCGDKLIISGVGGVFSADDAYAKIRAGASLVQMVTGLMFEGPQIVGEINRGLVKLLRRDGFANVGEAVGVDSAKITAKN